MTRRERIFWLVIGAALVIGFIFLIPACNQGYEQGDDAQQQQCAGNKVAFLAIRHAAEFIDAHNWILTALFAGLVTLFTWRLWQATNELRVSTDNLWSAGESQRLLSEKTAKRELRAYVLINDAKPTFDVINQDHPSTTFGVRNYGQTPANDVTVWRKSKFCSYPMNESEFAFEDVSDLWTAKIVLGPGGETSYAARTDIVLSDQQLQAIWNENWTIMVYGQIKYRDIFLEDQTTNFRLFYRRSAQGPLVVVPWSTGNEAT